ncbi:rust resistance kinase Lr10-like [Senna tora]|uniref:non-specific serine/threonine protein kinase n=1 Tax=Senna tora TaxID=362788 RepID=A0A834SSH9_9FABA|nr:rust resistance kinase Lr10-like [Senna tora]
MRNTKEPSRSTIIPFFLLSVLASSSSFFSFFVPKSLALEDEAHPYYCTAQCGDLHNISYPFRLRGQPSTCGDPDYTLSCENRRAVLELGAGKYFVKSIDYEKQVIRVVDVDLADGVSCSLPSASLDSWLNGDIRYRNTVYSHIDVGFVNCSKPISDSTFVRVPCMSGNRSIVYAVYTSAYVYEHQDSCSFPISTTLLNSDVDAKPPSSYEGVQKLLQNGFDLGWSVECRDCIVSGRECSFYSDPEPYFECRKPYRYRDTLIKIYLSFSAIGICESFKWDQIYQIALGVARGIEYLHTGTDSCTLHLHIKPRNILLDQNFVPKVSDFGLTKFHHATTGSEEAEAKYMAPEVMSRRNYAAASVKSDVYSFGMLVLEILEGLKNIGDSSSSNSFSVSVIYERLSKGQDLELWNNVTECEATMVRKLLMVGLWSIQANPSERPSMSKVVEMLEGDDAIDDEFSNPS